MYAYYWTHIIAPRIKGCRGEQYKEFENLLDKDKDHKGKAQTDYDSLISNHKQSLKTKNPNLLSTTKEPEDKV